MYSPKRRFRLFRLPAFSRPGGSLSFSSTVIASGSGLFYNNQADFRMGTGSFTIEWFQYTTSLETSPRVFSIGGYPTASIAASFQLGLFYLWRGSLNNTTFTYDPILNKWVHFAIVGENNTTIKIYQDGLLKATYTGTYDFNNTTNTLVLGNESGRAKASAFNGYITNFRWTKGTAVYTSEFTVPKSSLPSLADTKLLLLANTDNPFADSSGLNKAVSNNLSVVGASVTPF